MKIRKQIDRNELSAFLFAAMLCLILSGCGGGGGISLSEGAIHGPSPTLSSLSASASEIPAGDLYETVIVLEAKGVSAGAVCDWNAPGARFFESEAGLTEIEEPAACTVYAAFPGVAPVEVSVKAVNGFGESKPQTIELDSSPGSTSAQFEIHPYLQNCSQTSFEFVWTTDIASQGLVGIGTTEDANEMYELGDAGATTHDITFSGLTPGRIYHYKIYNDAALMDSGYTAHTNSDDPNEPFTFVALGDSGASGFEGTFQHTLGQLAAAEKPDLFIHTGDVVYQDGAAEDYPQKFFFPYRELLKSACAFPTLGNHDQHTDDGAPYLDFFHLPDNGSPDAADRETYYSFTYGDALFVSLHSQWDVYPAGNFDEGDRQREWFESLMQSTDKKWKIVFFHRPPYSSGRYTPGDGEMHDKAVPLFDQYNVDLVMSGHEHNYQRYCAIDNDICADGGVTYIVTGGGGQFLYGQQSEDDGRLAVFETQYNFVKATIDGDTLTMIAVNESGETIDSFTLTKP